MNIRKIVLAIITGASLTVGSLPAFAYSGEAYAKNARISLSKARGIALAAEPGRVVDTELEKENGGSGLRWSFDITPVAGGATHELGVDAMSGTLLENSVDGPNPD